MKRFAALIALITLFAAPLAMAAGTVTINRTTPQRGVEIVTIDWVADSAAATVPNTTLSLQGYVIKAVTNPGSVAPTDNYDIAFTDPEGTADLLAAALGDRDTTTTEQVYPLIAGSPGTVSAVPPFAMGTYTFTLTNNAVNSATGRAVLYLQQRP